MTDTTTGSAPVVAVYDFAGSVVVVTGGASGIGRDIVERLHHSNARVVVWDLVAGEQNSAQEPAELTIETDVASAAAVDAALARTIETVGTPTYLVNSAGITGRSAPLHELDPDEWRRVLAVNLDGTVNACRAVIPYLRRAGRGTIVTIASITGLDGNRNYAAYSASKAAIIALTQSLGKELAPDGVYVNAVAPAMVDTALLDSMDAAYIAECKAKSSLGRLVSAGEITSAVLWLMSDESTFTTGYTMPITGGRSV